MHLMQLSDLDNLLSPGENPTSMYFSFVKWTSILSELDNFFSRLNELARQKSGLYAHGSNWLYFSAFFALNFQMLTQRSWIDQSRQNHIGCIYLTFLHCEFSSVSSDHPPD